MGKHLEEEKKSIFKKFLIIYVIILTVVMLVFLGYVADSLIKYEKNQIENYMEDVISDLKKASKKGKIERYVDTSKITMSQFEKENTSINEGFSELLDTKKITYKLNKNSTENENPIYDIYADNEKILEVGLDGTQKENRLGLLTFNAWKTKIIEPKMEKGLYTCDILVPNNCSVYVNGRILTEEQIVEKVQNEGLTQISKYVEIPYIVKYEVTELLKEPEVKILDSKGNEVEYTQEGNTISKELDFISTDSVEDAMKNIKGKTDILRVAKDWSLYLTDDLEGRLHGYYNISKYLIDDSDIEKFAYSWATGVDITFVSSHTLLNPTFTDEKISNFEIYNENAFSCEVYLQKNLKLKSGGKKIEDKMNDRMYFAYYDETDDGKDNPAWKLVNMQSVTEKK
jgi:hypothetical protein